MIEEISIDNLGVIGHATLPLGAGFTAITGETGAGKTMVVTALGLLLGARADLASVRNGSDSAVVEGRWRVPAAGAVAARVRDAGGDLDAAGIDATIGPVESLLLSRTIAQEGRSRAIVGGRSAPVGVLAELGEHLVVVHGQSEQLRLRSGAAQRDALDRFGGAEIRPALTAYRDVFERWQHASAEWQRLTGEAERRAREADGLRAALTEIEAASPQRGEDVALAERIDRLSNLEDLRLAAEQAHELLSSAAPDGAADAITLLDTARRALDRVALHDPALTTVAESLADALYAVTDVSSELASYLAALDADGARELESLQERWATILAIARKYGPTLDDAIDYLDTGSARLLELDTDTDRIAELAEETDTLASDLDHAAATLTRARVAAASRLQSAVTAELAALAMPDAELAVAVTAKGELTASGGDAVAILLRPHPGTEPRPIAKGASGGELSRVMLAIEVVIAGSDPVPTFIFDEVDAGVGGAAAIEIGRRLARLAETAQVIVVTHLAQVAAFAGNHLRVVKDSDGSVTASSVVQLDADARAAEMARLLSGLTDSATGLSHARELLDLAAGSPARGIR